MIRLATLILVTALIAACASGGAGRELTQTLDAYAKYIRWHEIEQALGFVDPETRVESHDEAFELSRFENIRVTSYEVKSRDLSPDEKQLTQTVQLRIYNVHNLRERTVVDRQRWRFDDDADRWLLTSGLPDLSRR